MGKDQQGQSKFFSWYHRSVIVRFLLQITPWVMRTFSRKGVHRIRYPFIFLYYCLGTRFRRAVRENLRIALGSTVSERELRRITRGVFDNVTKSFADSFYVASIPPERWPEMMDPPVGSENIGQGPRKGEGGDHPDRPHRQLGGRGDYAGPRRGRNPHGLHARPFHRV